MKLFFKPKLKLKKFSIELPPRTTGVADVPKQDRHLALNLLLEFSVQKGTLREMLDTVMLLFRIWNRERSPQGPNSIAKFSARFLVTWPKYSFLN